MGAVSVPIAAGPDGLRVSSHGDLGGPAMVLLHAPPSAGDPALKAVMSLKKAGCTVICCARALDAWPLASRCAALYMGASALIDRSSPSFAAELERAFAEGWATASVEQEASRRLREVMGSLGVVGTSKAMSAVIGAVQRVGPLSDLPVLITGETGTGKQLLAEGVHKLDPKRMKGPFVPVNCGALPREIALAELFGHKRGAFTGAVDERKGLFRAAHGGVLFLDEVGELDLTLQTALLRTLQERRVLGLGDDREVDVDVRVVAATNRDLSRMVEEGAFRADLYHRLRLVSITIPPLRTRSEDCAPLVEHFLHKHAGVCKLPPKGVSEDFLEVLRGHDFPGNTRELEHIVLHALITRSDGGVLGLGDLPSELLRPLCEASKAPCAHPAPLLGEATSSISGEALIAAHFQRILEEHEGGLNAALDHCEKLIVETALTLCNGNQSQAARLLSITPRSVYNKLRKHGISP